MSKYHYHLTIKDCTADELNVIAKKVKAKATTIDLISNIKDQRDRMITKYWKDYDELFEQSLVDKNTIENMGFDVVRIKIEEVVDEFSDDSLEGALMLECHVKVEDKENLKPVDGFVLSKNPVDGTRFYNARVYNKEELQSFFKNIGEIDNVISIQKERVLFDSNHERDSWWEKEIV